MTEAQQLENLVDCVSDWRFTQSLAVASTALFFYDYALTFRDETRFLWVSERPTYGRILFFLVRYVAFAGAVLSILQASIALANVLTCFRFITIVVADLIFATRTWAIWERNRRVLYFLILLSIGCVVPIVVITKEDITTTVWGPSVAPNVSSASCQVMVSTVKNIWVVPFAIAIIYEFINLSLSMYRILAYFRDVPITTRSPLMHVLWTDGIMYFVFMLLLGVLNIVLILQVSAPQLRGGGIELQVVLHSILSTRAVLHLSSAATTSPNGSAGDVLTEHKFSTMIFPTAFQPSHDTAETGETSTFGGAYTYNTTLDETRSSTSRTNSRDGLRSVPPLPMGPQDVEMGVMRIRDGGALSILGRGMEDAVKDEFEGKTMSGDEVTVLEVPRSSLSSGPSSP